MSNLYKTTTESVESLQNISCASKLTGCGYKSPGKKKAVTMQMSQLEREQEQEQERNDFDQ